MKDKTLHILMTIICMVIVGLQILLGGDEKYVILTTYLFFILGVIFFLGFLSKVLKK